MSFLIFQIRKLAFTLPEVLITLAIIGVVSAMTMPSLINKTQERQFITAWKKNFAEISDACLRLKNDDISLKDMNDFDRINNLAKYIKHTKICDVNQFVSGGCSPKSYNIYEYSGKLFTEDMGKIGGGSACMLTNRGAIICVDLHIIVDVNGHKRPNTVGKDIFYAVLSENDMIVRPAIGRRAGYGATDGIIYNGIVTAGNGTCQEADLGYGCSAEKLLK